MEGRDQTTAFKPGGKGLLLTEETPMNIRADYLTSDMTYHEKLAHKYWRDIFFCGTELDNYDAIFTKPWLFPHLGEDLDTDGALYTAARAGRHVYLFGTSEPKIIGQVFVSVPVICAISSTMPIPEQVGIKSVQMNSIDILSFDSLNLSFREEVLAYEKVDKMSKKKIAINVLALNRRISAVKYMSETQLNRYKYANLYIFRPDSEEQDLKDMVEPTNVTVEVTHHKQTVTDLYEEKENPVEAAKNLVKKHFSSTPCTAAELDQIAKQLKSAMTAEKTRYKNRVENIKKRLNECSAEYKKALSDMHIIKYYPYLDNERADIRTNKFTNRFYGDAAEVKGAVSPYETREEFEQRIQDIEAKRAERARRLLKAEEKRAERMIEMKKQRELNPPKKRLTRADRIKMLEAELDQIPEIAARKKKEAAKDAARAKAARERAARVKRASAKTKAKAKAKAKVTASVKANSKIVRKIKQ